MQENFTKDMERMYQVGTTRFRVDMKGGSSGVSKVRRGDEDHHISFMNQVKFLYMHPSITS